MVHIVPTNKQETARQTAELFVRYVVKYHGLPRSIQTDRNSKVTSAFWQDLCDILDIKVRSTAAYHPQANGQAERTNQTVKQLLRTAHQQGQNWVSMIDIAEIAINSAPISHTRYSPFFHNYGFEPCVFPDIHNLASPINAKTELAQLFGERMRDQWKAARKWLQHHKNQSVEQANKARIPHDFRPGMKVLVRMNKDQQKSLAQQGKLGQKYAGPYIIRKSIGNNSFKLELPTGTRTYDVFHSSRLIPYHERRDYEPQADEPPLPDWPKDWDQPEALFKDVPPEAQQDVAQAQPPVLPV